MHIVRTIAKLRAQLAQLQSATFVPTMGNLNDGHLRLVRMAMPTLNGRVWQPNYVVFRRRDVRAPQWVAGTNDWVVLGAARIGKSRMINSLKSVLSMYAARHYPIIKRDTP